MLNKMPLSVLAMALICGLNAPTHALTININPGATLSGNAAALAAFNRAANTWESIFTDPISVNIDADLAFIADSSVIGATNPVTLQAGYTTIRNQMVVDAADEPGDAIVSSLPTAAQFTAFVPTGFGLTGLMQATKANLKAMGFTGLDGSFGATDATMTFSTNFAFDFDNSDGVGAGLTDFETVALHELGHALGFTTIVDSIDFLVNNGQTANVNIGAFDLFRFPAATPPTNPSDFTNDSRLLVPRTEAVFSDTVNDYRLSTGRFTGDGRQASHFKDDSLTGTLIGVMDPTLGTGTIENVSPADIRVLDLIGYDVRVPEPGTLVLVGFGLAGLGFVRRRRPACVRARISGPRGPDGFTTLTRSPNNLHSADFTIRNPAARR